MDIGKFRMMTGPGQSGSCKIWSEGFKVIF